MHVLLASDHYPPQANGHAVAAAWWVRALLEADVRVTVVMAGRAPRAGLVEHEAYREVWLDASRVIRDGHPLAALTASGAPLRTLAADPPNVVHLHGYGPLCARAAAYAGGAAIVATVHQFPEGAGVRAWPMVHATMRWALRRLFARARVAFAPSHRAAERLRTVTQHRDVRVLPTGVDPAFERFGRHAAADATDTATGTTDAATAPGPHVLYVGRRSPDKRFQDVVALARRYPAARWSALGTGSPARANAWPAHLRLLPHAPAHEVAAIMHAADVLLAPSLNETQGLAVFEALTVGTPVVAPSGTAQAEPLREGVNGALYDPDDLSSAWRAIERAALLARSGVRDSATPYRREALVRRLLSAYVEVGAQPT